MAKNESNHITSCTISWENTEDILSVVTKVLQTEIHVRLYNNDNLIGGRIWPMSEQQKQELYCILYKCIEDWDCDDYTVDGSDGNHWQFKICTQRSCLRTICGSSEPPPHGVEIKKILTGIIGEDNCYFF
ncbi:MAG: hypothetical protein J6A94_03195 [Lachnospiraceae bacterium]|nr:hypothetical protein [Lachnospiraceae bacterium]